jgi:hypothetical protein
MPYEYVCTPCDAVSPAGRDRQEDAADELVEHRRAAHGGLRPRGGDGVRRVHTESRGDAVLPSGWVWAALFLLLLVLAKFLGH